MVISTELTIAFSAVLLSIVRDVWRELRTDRQALAAIRKVAGALEVTRADIHRVQELLGHLHECEEKLLAMHENTDTAFSTVRVERLLAERVLPLLERIEMRLELRAGKGSAGQEN